MLTWSWNCQKSMSCSRMLRGASALAVVIMTLWSFRCPWMWRRRGAEPRPCTSGHENLAMEDTGWWDPTGQCQDPESIHRPSWPWPASPGESSHTPGCAPGRPLKARPHSSPSWIDAVAVGVSRHSHGHSCACPWTWLSWACRANSQLDSLLDGQWKVPAAPPRRIRRDRGLLCCLSAHPVGQLLGGEEQGRFLGARDCKAPPWDYVHVPMCSIAKLSSVNFKTSRKTVNVTRAEAENPHGWSSWTFALGTGGVMVLSKGLSVPPLKITIARIKIK